ncbi:MAG TPA: hypothetical protein VLT91_02915 [Rhizomicrobium sp.]|nr:hypothetical protein [Rhizomicrobium sp.]
MSRPSPGAVATLIAIAYAAYFVADIAHEALGHGGMCLALGGKLVFLSTTFEDCSIHSRLIDGAGPTMGIIVALLAWGWLTRRPPRDQNMRAFLLLTFAFAIFWNVFYLIRSGITDQGDWAFVIAGLEPKLAWHVAMTIVGVALYGLAVRATAASLRADFPQTADGFTPFAFTLTALVAAVILSAIAAQFDTRSVAPNMIDKLPSALAALGLVWAGWTTTRAAPDLRVAIPQSLAWTTIGAASAIFFVLVLGPGLRF